MYTPFITHIVLTHEVLRSGRLWAVIQREEIGEQDPNATILLQIDFLVLHDLHCLHHMPT